MLKHCVVSRHYHPIETVQLKFAICLDATGYPHRNIINSVSTETEGVKLVTVLTECTGSSHKILNSF